MKILFTILLTILYFFSYGQGCTITTSNLVEISGDDGFGNCTYSIDILFIEGNGPDNGTLTFSSSSATILTGAGPHSCVCSGNTYHSEQYVARQYPLLHFMTIQELEMTVRFLSSILF